LANKEWLIDVAYTCKTLNFGHP